MKYNSYTNVLLIAMHPSKTSAVISESHDVSWAITESFPEAWDYWLDGSLN